MGGPGWNGEVASALRAVAITRFVHDIAFFALHADRGNALMRLRWPRR
jgi:hypothetical protein